MKRFLICLLLLGSGVLLFLNFPRPKSPQIASLTKAEKAAAAIVIPPVATPLLRSPSTNTKSAAAIPVADEESLAALTTFSDWTETFLSGDPNANSARGEALAWKRREAMSRLIESDPEKAIAMTVPFSWRSKLPANVTRHFEQQIDGRGNLTVAVATDFERGKTAVFREAQINDKRYKAFVYGRRVREVSQYTVPLHGIALDGKMAVHSDAIRIVNLEEAKALELARSETVEEFCGVSSQPADVRQQKVAGDIGGSIRYFCGVDHVRLVNEQLLRSGETDSFVSANHNNWTHGVKTLLYMRLNFPDDLTEPISEANAYRIMDGANEFFVEGSYGLTSLMTTVTPLMTLPNTKAWYSTAGPGTLLEHARELARDNGFETDNYHLDIVAFTTVPDYDFGGLAAVHGKALWLQSTGVGVTAHELGHNYGLWHANLWDAITNYSSTGIGTNWEYGNIFDTMGQASAGRNQFNAMHKNILDWLPEPTIQNITSNGVYRIHSFDVPTRVNGNFYAAKVRKDFQRDYWIEFRQQFTSNPWLQYGVMLNWAPWVESSGGTHLIDTTPGSPTGGNSREDAAVVVGRTFSDRVSGVHITPLARGGEGLELWMDVQVNSGAFETNRSPVMKIEIDPTNAAPGELIHFHAAATDPDGDALAYTWTFDDLTFSTNNLPWVSKSWNSSGDHVVRCVVSDMKGGVASANTVITIGQSTGYRITGRITDKDGNPLEGVRVDNSKSEDAAYNGGYTDSYGDYVLVNVTDMLNLDAFEYGIVLTNVFGTGPFFVTSNTVNMDFIAVPRQTVSITVTTNTVPENGIVTNEFILTRNAEYTNELSVNVFLSGTATISSDFSLSPTLTSGANVVVFPEGEQTVSFVFNSINDASVEGPQTVTLTITEDFPALFIEPPTPPSYFIGVMAEATVTILDDDLPNRPVVSLATITPSVPENGIDVGAFSLSRTGSTASELTVFYSVNGTATSGKDYASLLGVAIIPVGSASTTIQFQTIDDKNVELEETVVLTLEANAGYTINGSSAQTKIVDDDLLTVTIFPIASTAGEPSTPGRFTVKREGDLSANLLVHYTASGVAISGSDYIPFSGSVTIPATLTSADIVLTPSEDPLVEGDESVILTLKTNIAYNIGTPAAATLFIRDNEKQSVSITATDGSTSEPGDDTGAFQISRGSITSGALTVFLAVNGTAYSGSDYVPLESVVVIPDGTSSVVLDIIAFDDLHQEPLENIILTILPSTNYNIGSRQAQVSIADNDSNASSAVGFSFHTSSAVESKSPGIAVSLSATSTVPITVDFRVLSGTASSNDYTLPSSSLTFEPGERAKSIELEINNDSNVEPAETIRIVLFNPIGGTHDGIKIHTYTIVDDDTSSISVSATVASAFETGPANGNFRVTRNGSTNAPLVVNFELTGTASEHGDFTALGKSVTIPAGATFVDLPVVPLNDQTVEHSETVEITLLTAPTAKIASPNSATITITDNDPDLLPLVTVTSIDRPTAIEGGTNGGFVFTRMGTAGALTLHFSLTGTALNGADYVALTNTVTIPDGQTSASVLVFAIDDAIVEGEETVVLSLTVEDTYLAAHPASATVILQDNDERVWIDASDFIASEPGIDIGEFTFTRFGTTNTPLQVFFTISGVASNGVDYVSIPNSFTIPAGSVSAILPIMAIDDLIVEGPEKMTLTLVSNAAYSLGQPTNGTVTIDDDEPMLTISATQTNIVEGSRPPSAFRITRTGDPKYSFTALLAVGGTATQGVDYPPLLTNVYFSCGVVGIDLVVAPTNELAIEAAETVTAAILPHPDYTILSPSNSLITIADAGENQTPVVTITSALASTVYLLGTNAGLILEATITDDNDPNIPLLTTWKKMNGPDTLEFGDTNLANTTVLFTNVGVYVLRLTADDGLLQGFAELTVVLGAQEFLSTNGLHWALNEEIGTNVSDISGAGRNGTWTGNPNWNTNGVMVGSAQFSGTNDFIEQTSDTNVLDGLKAFSISFWINSAIGNADQGIFSAHSGTNTTLAFATRTNASCGNSSNVVEVTIPTTSGIARHVSASNTLTNGWQHIALTWTNGLAPALYINGELDQPLSQFVALSGVLSNCTEFIVGKGPSDLPSWNGLIDDVRVFKRALSPGEARALGNLPPANSGPVVFAGADVILQLTTPLELIGTVIDDGNPIPPGAVSNVWSVVSTPLDIVLTILDPNNLTNTIQFAQPGDYVFRLISDDGEVKVFDDILVTVVEPTLVYVFAVDGDAAELGPNEGQFTVSRFGDLELELTVFLALSGTASNEVDFLPLTNTVTFLAGVDSINLPVIPFLDDRIEGDETIIFSIITNLSYTVGSGEAIVTLHDSPYGAWSVQHFTLEELTFPGLSGATGDFDHDGLINFIEYVSNRNPKSSDTTPPLVTAVELNPNNSQNYITLTYKRRLSPTDTAYEVLVSNDMKTWNTGEEYVTELLVTDDGNGITETVKAQLVQPSLMSTNYFINLRVTLMTTGP